MSTYTVHKAKTQFSKLVREVERGAEVVIARGSVAVARLVPIHPRVERRAGALAGQLEVPDSFFEPLPAEELDAWEK